VGSTSCRPAAADRYQIAGVRVVRCALSILAGASLCPLGCRVSVRSVARARGHTLERVADDVLTLEELRRRRAEILGVARKRRAHRIAVFGSVARGEARPDSDLDLLVDFEPGTSLLDYVGLFQDLEELLGVGVDVVARNALKPRDDHIRAEAVDL
jgi:predicted nucleotidyltransferase